MLYMLLILGMVGIILVRNGVTDVVLALIIVLGRTCQAKIGHARVILAIVGRTWCAGKVQVCL